MKWLKRSLRYLPDDFWEAARCEYRANLELVKPRLPASVMRLATEVSLHDAKVERLRLTAACNTQLTLIAGDSDRGYIELRMGYEDALPWGAQCRIFATGYQTRGQSSTETRSISNTGKVSIASSCGRRGSFTFHS